MKINSLVKWFSYFLEDILIEGRGGRPKRAFGETVKKNLFQMVLPKTWFSEIEGTLF